MGRLVGLSDIFDLESVGFDGSFGMVEGHTIDSVSFNSTEVFEISLNLKGASFEGSSRNIGEIAIDIDKSSFNITKVVEIAADMNSGRRESSTVGEISTSINFVCMDLSIIGGIAANFNNSFTSDDTAVDEISNYDDLPCVNHRLLVDNENTFDNENAVDSNFAAYSD